MTNDVVLGSGNGDEGKGRIVHYMSKDYEWVIRSSGGNNCGHTIYCDGKKYVHHLVPSIDFRRPNIKGFLSSGMVIDLDALHQELLDFEKDFPGVSSRIYVDPDAFTVLDKHRNGDIENVKRIGSTNKGVGPAYVDKMNRCGVKIYEMIEKNHESIVALQNLGVNFKYVLELKNDFLRSNCLFEGSQGIMLDLNHGTYPYVSCGDATVASIYSSGFAFIKLNRVYGVAKCYSTKVGEGPFPTEIFGKEAEKLRERGREYGATTGRPRRIGWLDLPALKYACIKGGITHLIITKFDVLDGMEKVPLAVSYGKDVVSAKDFFDAKPIYSYMNGWKQSKTKTVEVIEIKNFLDTIQNIVGVPISYISYGTSEEDICKIQ
jgi:adenylosuccinate synthase